MDVAVFSARSWDRTYLPAADPAGRHAWRFLDVRLEAATAPLAAGSPVVSAFVNDRLDARTLAELARHGVGLVALRCTGFNQVDLEAARQLGIRIGRVPAYSPHAVAEHALALMLALNRKIHRAWTRVREGNFALDGLVGFDMKGKTVGVVGTGAIGRVMARILLGLECRVIATDPVPDPELAAVGVAYLPFPDLAAESDILTLHCPLTPETHHLVDAAAIARMKPGVMIINTSRGAVVDTRALIAGLKSGRIGSLGLDVYEEESHLFFRDLSDRGVPDDVFARLLTFPNVIVTGHQGFFTHEALSRIAQVTVANIEAFAATGVPVHEVSVERLAA
ncbi:MAG: 2-hydroxyacid dehydrogenase [Sphingomonadaceae bacterium]|uniref:2-hydroxyacid dehydrogenase n=1 Tax=Thermaurantiacus sp. TaxID=2820283 RepID=UPI00298EDA77|nr:2-hydroxyacid dehydrogenase [Thermaurantiacus sp.]MCS6987098.1 2-hydroxyacid dehydrogenase [Sphingomonadaceae bacterium]MDW8415564.1 2-hydroxyacid dehydrogenase [Thermaurantiacus sp.]